MRGIAFLSFICFLLFVQGCANRSFYLPSKSDELNPNVRWLKSASGNDLAYLWLPSQISQNKGLILHFHGNTGHMEQTKEKVEWLVEHGYSVLIFDYSGFGHSTGYATDIALYHDALSILEFTDKLRSRLMLPTFIVATSTGGNIFLRAWADKPIEIEGIIIDSSFTSYVEEAEHVLKQSLFGHFYDWLAGILMRDDYAVESVFDQLPEARTLVIHCIEDEVVPIESGREVYTRLGGEKQFWPIDRCAHARAMTWEFPDIQMRLVDWLEAATSATEVALTEKWETS
ncbi:alpha/beta fold hydrolase [uncultured Photobacterium sp.]|uniref:alpha/beta hydrolase n=1 Tax=uncultured Photobacterium sp. TaxID=173973 RepID=UPI00262B0156|nr:alpha/beta fold hydrolase [uncultured Photobacterium sp.]